MTNLTIWGHCNSLTNNLGGLDSLPIKLQFCGLDYPSKTFSCNVYLDVETILHDKNCLSFIVDIAIIQISCKKILRQQIRL